MNIDLDFNALNSAFDKRYILTHTFGMALRNRALETKFHLKYLTILDKIFKACNDCVTVKKIEVGIERGSDAALYVASLRFYRVSYIHM